MYQEKIDSFDQLEGFYEQLNQLVKEMVNAINDSKKIVNKMNNNDTWNGEGYNTFNEKYNALSRNFGSYSNGLYQLNNNIKRSIDRYKKLEDQIMKDVHFNGL